MSEEIKKKKHRLSNITFGHSGGHIALVGPSVGGPANQQETVLWKSKATDHISESDVSELLKSKTTVEKVGLEKAKFNSEVRSELRDKVEEQYSGKYEWLYLEDFSEDKIVFSSDSGLFIVDYSLSDDGYVLGDQAIGVEYKSILVENGALKLSNDAQSKLNEGVYSLVTKSLDDPETSERVKDVIKSVKEKAIKMEEEIQKAVDAANALSAAALVEVQVELTKAKDALAALAAEKQAVLMKSRQEQVAQYDKDGAEAITKATEKLDDDAFAVILKALAASSAVVDASDLLKQVSDPNAQEKQTEESATAALIKARYAQQK